jgi:hypothetical protein
MTLLRMREWLVGGEGAGFVRNEMSTRGWRRGGGGVSCCNVALSK